jgi:hypothetical protein
MGAIPTRSKQLIHLTFCDIARYSTAIYVTRLNRYRITRVTFVDIDRYVQMSGGLDSFTLRRGVVDSSRTYRSF